jgi:hypothetical protein
MIRLFKYLFTGDLHLHVWEKIGSQNINTYRQYGVLYHCQCKHCGQIKGFMCGN